MKKLNAVAKALATALLVCSAGMVSAADTQNLTVSATVSGVCKFTSTAQTLAFGTVDPSVAGPISGSGAAVTYKCTKGTPATSVSGGNGLHHTGTSRAMKNGANTDVIAYSLTITNDTQTGDGFGSGSTDKSLGVAGQIVAADYANASAGSYSDTVVLTIAP